MAIGKFPVAALLLLSAIGVNTAAQDPASPAPEPAAHDPNVPPVSTAVAQTVDDPNQPVPLATPPGVETDSPAQDKNSVSGQAGPVSPAGTSGSTKRLEAGDSMNMAQVIALLQQQQQDLADQKKLLQAQANQITQLQQEVDVLRAPAPRAVMTEETLAKADSISRPGAATGKEAIAATSPAQDKEQRDKEAGQEVAKAQADDPTVALLEDFTGAWRLPGTDAALSIGGFVKTTIVYNFDPLEIRDRFIVGSIPVEDVSGIEAQSSITASQSRLNFDLREPTEYGVLRAFIEGDFAEENDTFRLRHAFGQWKKVLAGKTWSAFVDTAASPEEVDFEGLNGRINVRQSQLRFMPSIGEQYEFQFSLEDPNPQIQNGKGVTRAPDAVASGRFQLYDRLHVKVGLLLRQIRGQRDSDLGGGLEKEYGWGTTVSGRFLTPKFDERDSLMFQLNAGTGIGRYVNDLASVGSFDGIFDPESGDLELFDVLSGYLSWQHWWHGNIRSNFTLGAVEVDNPDFVEGSAYQRTLRLSTNIFWMPTPRIDIGAEYLWGNRKNEDGENDDATQIQLAARYRF